MAHRALLSLPVLAASFIAQAQVSGGGGVIGSWREPGGSIIRIAPCGQALCATLTAISPSAPTPFDGTNPDPAKRTRRLCGLNIGYGFHQIDPTHADGGELYDPKTGKTYHGEMSSSGDTLKLRGYVGIRAFGRTESWTRVNAPKPGCS